MTNEENSEIHIGPEWQERCLKEIKGRPNVILSSPTGSGKTRVFKEWAKDISKGPIFITAPIKALSNQRYRELKEEGYKVGLETGDIKNVPEDCEVICCTQEIYTNKYAELEDATLIIDEVHYIFENSERARTYVDALNKSKAKNIMLCSATLGDLERMTEYVEKVSEREFYTYENHDRLTELYYKDYISPDKIKNALVVTFSLKNIELILNQLYKKRQYEDIDENKKQKIIEIAEKYKIQNEGLLEFAKYGLSGYCGALLPKEKLFIEECFEQKVIDTVVGTDALALGVNFPVENVVFAQLAKYYDGPISKNLFEQLAGRAGRKGYFDIGNVYYCDSFGPIEAYGIYTDELYSELLEAENESISIELKQNIKDILKGKTSIEEEARYISKYSLSEYSYDEGEVKANLVEIIKNIESYDLVKEVIKVEFEIGDDEYDYYTNYEEYAGEEEFETSQEDEEELVNRISERQKELMPLQEEFHKNIADAYFEEYGWEKNCYYFTHVLRGVEVYPERFERFSDVLQIRKYFRQLPKKYRKTIDFKKLEDYINEVDHTALNLDRGAVTVADIARGTQNEQVKSQEMLGVLKAIGESIEDPEKQFTDKETKEEME